MSEQTVKGGIEAGPSEETVKQEIDPELVDDRDVDEADQSVVILPDYDDTQFELPDDFEYVEDGEDDG